MMLRNRKNNQTIEEKMRRKNEDSKERIRRHYSPTMVPQVYYKDGGNNLRPNIQEYSYRGNF